MNRFFYYLLFIYVFMASCSNEGEKKEGEKPNLPNNFVISGKIMGAANQPVRLESMTTKGMIKIAETTISVSGDFELIGNVKGMGLYQLTVGTTGTKSIPITISPNEKAEIISDYATFERLPLIKGVKWGAPITEYMRLFNDFAMQQSTLMVGSQHLSKAEQISQFLKIRKPLDDFARSFMLKEPSNPANIVLSTSLTPVMGFDIWDSTNLDVLKKVSLAFKESYPNSPITKSLFIQVVQINEGFNRFKGVQSGNVKAPEINLPSPDGASISLSSLKGSVVLIDFWASWCGPCRKSNPELVKLYAKFKSKGFTIYSVSLDSDKEAWKGAIKADGLSWPNHVSDLKQWKTPLINLYNLSSIPFTVLVNKKGDIVGTNLHGTQLESKISQIL